MPKNQPRPKGKGAIFLDRDGVINASPKTRYVTRWEQFRFLPGTLTALKRLQKARKTVVILSNQAGVGRGIMTKEALNAIHTRMMEKIQRAGGQIHAVYTCPHKPEDHCRCRKPRLGMLRRAARQLHIDPKRSILVGDNATDIRLGSHAGCATILVLSGKTSRSAAKRMNPKPDQVCLNLGAAVCVILKTP